MHPFRPSILAFAAVAALVVVGLAAIVPPPATAACGGGGFDETYLARRVGRHADTIILGRLIRVDEERAHHYELLEVYRGDAPASPIQDSRDPAVSASGMIDVGGCTNQRVEPGGLFVYAEGQQAARFGRLQIIFPRVREDLWLIGHFGTRSTLDELLVLLGVLPATSTVQTATTVEQPRSVPPGWMAAFAGVTVTLYGAFAGRSRGITTRPPTPRSARTGAGRRSGSAPRRDRSSASDPPRRSP